MSAASPVFPTRSARSRAHLFNASIVLAFLALSYLVLARACAFDHAAIGRYAAYLAFQVGLPGVIVVSATFRRRLTWLEAATLGLPVGYAVEILSFLGLAALQARALYPWLPLGWGLAAALWMRRAGGAHCFLSGPPRVPGWVGLAVGGVLASTVVSAIAHLFVASPLVAGQPASETFHDWVYLISRVGEIMHRWPLEDPSLAGTPLQYHYFLLVHVAAASLATGEESSLVLLRLALIPLGWILVLQAYALGSRLTGHRAAGVLAGLLAVVAGEVSFAPEMAARFGSAFVHWLYLSPTFFFGMVFTGALVLLLSRYLDAAVPVSARERVLLVIMAGAATGAKGTVMPPLIVAYGAWIVLQAWQTRRFPARLVATGVCIGAGFSIVYLRTMAGWGTGDATFSPFLTLPLTPFWQEHQRSWAEWLSASLPLTTSGTVAGLACGVISLVGGAGVRLLAWPFLAMRGWHRDRAAVTWLALVGGSQFAFGHLLHLDSYGQFYLSLAARVPAAVLAAAFMVCGFRALQRTPGAWRVFLIAGACGVAGLTLVVIPGWAGLLLLAGGALWLAPRWKTQFAGIASGGRGLRRSGRGVLAGLGFAAVLVVTLLQVNQWRLQSIPGVGVWLGSAPREEAEDLTALKEGLAWIRAHTERDAILVVNAFTSRNLRAGAVATLDRTTVDKYYYYSAYSERRLWIEGPAYLRNHPAVRDRVKHADALFYGGGAWLEVRPLALGSEEGPCYIVVDRALRDGAQPGGSGAQPVFKNRRLDVFRVPEALPAAPAFSPVVMAPGTWTLGGDGHN